MSRPSFRARPIDIAQALAIVRDESVLNDESQAVAREVTDALKPLAMSKNLKMVVEIPGVLRVRGDAVRLRQVLNNLLNNALKFTEEGFVRLVLKYARGTLEGTVSDSGPGIAGSECDDIFEPFYSRGDGSGGGAGLGLSVSREMIEQQKDYKFRI